MGASITGLRDHDFKESRDGFKKGEEVEVTAKSLRTIALGYELRSNKYLFEYFTGIAKEAAVCGQFTVSHNHQGELPEAVVLKLEALGFKILQSKHPDTANQYTVNLRW